MRRFAGREGVGQEGLRGFQVPFLHACIAAQGETQLDTSEPAEGLLVETAARASSMHPSMQQQTGRLQARAQLDAVLVGAYGMRSAFT